MTWSSTSSLFELLRIPDICKCELNTLNIPLRASLIKKIKKKRNVHTSEDKDLLTLGDIYNHCLGNFANSDFGWVVFYLCPLLRGSNF